MATQRRNDDLVSYKDGEMFIQCIRCKETKHEKNFHKNHNYYYGRVYTCSQCMAMATKSPTLETADETNASAAKEILMCMGYDVEKNIHTQFLKRMKDKGRNI